jgi:hypothetical protein
MATSCSNGRVHHRATGALRGEEASINLQDAHVQRVALGSPVAAGLRNGDLITAFKTTVTGRRWRHEADAEGTGG